MCSRWPTEGTSGWSTAGSAGRTRGTREARESSGSTGLSNSASSCSRLTGFFFPRSTGLFKVDEVAEKSWTGEMMMGQRYIPFWFYVLKSVLVQGRDGWKSVPVVDTFF